jgi:hypothetical protein
MNSWTVAAWGVGAVIVLYALHRLALWLEREGWIRYLRSPPQAGAGGTAAFGELHQILEPTTKHVYELKQQKRPRREADGGDPRPPSAGP